MPNCLPIELPRAGASDSVSASATAPLPTGAWLAPRDGHCCWWGEGGDPAGTPVLVVHGGPGGASRTDAARWFDGLPVRWILLDQRGCGRSKPLGGVEHNDLAALLDDMERLRLQLRLERWALLGGSWGARVAVAYAARHSDRVTGLLLRSPFFGTPPEAQRYVAPWRQWLGHAGREWLDAATAEALFALYQGATSNDRSLVFSLDDVPPMPPAFDNDRLAQAWSAFDDQQSVPGGVQRTGATFSAESLPAVTPALNAAWQVHAHYAWNQWGGTEGPWPALQPFARRRVPACMVWGADDATCGPDAASALAAAWPGMEAIGVAGAGHRISDPALGPALHQAVRRWAATLPRE